MYRVWFIDLGVMREVVMWLKVVLVVFRVYFCDQIDFVRVVFKFSDCFGVVVGRVFIFGLGLYVGFWSGIQLRMGFWEGFWLLVVCFQVFLFLKVALFFFGRRVFFIFILFQSRVFVGQLGGQFRSEGSRFFRVEIKFGFEVGLVQVFFVIFFLGDVG